MSPDVVMDKFPYHKGRRWIQVLQTKDKAQRQAIIRGIFENGGFDATVDFPPCALADDLAAMYPDAKFILTVRKSAKAWRTSFNSTIGMTKTYWFEAMTSVVPSLRMSLHLLHSAWDEVNATRHNDWVKQVVPADRLLIHEASQGWGPLCKFLEHDIPDVPYPHICDAQHFRRVVYIAAGIGAMLWAFWGGAIAWMVELAWWRIVDNGWY